MKKENTMELNINELELVVGGRTLSTGEEITIEVIDEYEKLFKSIGLTADELIITNYAMGFYPTDDKLIAYCMRDGTHIDQWASKQRSKVRQDIRARNGEGSYLDQWSTG